MIALREIVNRDIFKDFEVPKEFGNEFEMILVPINNVTKKNAENNTLMQHQEENGFSKNILAQTSEDIWDEVSENEHFLGAIYNSVIEENDEEDKIWSKYL